MSNPAQVSLRGLVNCGCCSGIRAETPAEIRNRAGLSAIAYRVGTHAQIKESMLAALSDSSRPALQSLRTRDDDDFSIALLDAVAMMADVLSFYQERIANECYLRTATERRSVLEMARLIGYELRAGVAANAFLAFTLDEAIGAPKQVSIDIGSKVQSIPAPGQKPQTFETIEKIDARSDWNDLQPQRTIPQSIGSGLKQLYLKGIGTQLAPGDAILIVGDERLNNPNSKPDRERWDFRIVETVTPYPKLNATRVTWDKGLGSGPTAPAAQNVKCFALRQRAKLFGNNAPDWYAMSDSVRIGYLSKAKRDISKYNRSDPSTWGGEDWPTEVFSITTAAQSQIDLDAAYPKIVKDGWVVLLRVNDVQLYKVTHAKTVSRSDFALASASTQLTLDTNANLAGFGLRDTAVFAQSEQLEIADLPSPDVTGAAVMMDSSANLSGIEPGRWLAASGIDNVTGEPIGEITSVSAVSGATITLNPSLGKTYQIDSFLFNANVARATHGETVQDVLGGGDASTAFQKFTLKQPPLTFTSAANAGGAASTLEVRVNDLLWQEVPTLYGKGPQDHVFISRRDDAGDTGLEFGDGVTGARLPTGQMNVRARYRKGIGLGGMLTAGQLSLLLSRPQGLKGVTNPVDTNGAQDPEQLADARANAPLTVLTLDRAVSLEDYEDYSRAFAGVAKAMATWTWDGQARSIFITVAGPRGTQVSPDSDTFRNLVRAIQKAGDPFVPIRVSSYHPAVFRFGGTVKVDADFETDKVLAAVEQALRSAFSFDARSFGQAVYLSEVIELVQSIRGVVAVEVSRLYRADSVTPALEQRLLAALPEPLASGAVAEAELLMLDAGPLDMLGVMS
ncbi:putative baseplate assembly protein [Burkholderia sp. YR290]|nr:putative baseplate assembly protein [Burkholderia sp. YR290]